MKVAGAFIGEHRDEILGFRALGVEEDEQMTRCSPPASRPCEPVFSPLTSQTRDLPGGCHCF